MNCTGPTARRRARKARDRMRQYRSVCELVVQRDGAHCRVCKGFLRNGAHHHHVTPRSLGGKHTTENIALVCPDCHHAIHDKRVSVTGNADAELVIEWRSHGV